MIGYPGGKTSSAIVPRLLGLMPAHLRYAEPFMGYGGLLWRKRPAPEYDIGIDLDPLTCARVRARNPGFIVVDGDGIQWLSSAAAWLDPSWLLYVDPPYLGSVRARGIYRYEMESRSAHSSLLTILQAIKCNIMLSGYASWLYEERLERKGWHLHRFKVMSRGGERTECVWCNFNGNLPLHQPSLAGGNFRERERVKRKKQRWASRLSAMAAAERQAVCEALIEVDRPALELAMRTGGGRLRSEG